LISSSQVYGIVDKTNQPISEDSRVQPVNYYGASKAAAENIAYAFYSEHGLPVCIIRPFNHIGRGQDRHFLISKLIDAARKGIKDIELGQTDVVRDFTDVRDVIDAYCRIIKNFQAGDFFNICRGIGYRLDDVIYSIEKLSNIKFNISRNNEFIRKNDIPFMIGDNAKISRFFDWSPKYSLEDTLKWILSE
jgi:nucleoside-diphosphate-sugar epimerase